MILNTELAMKLHVRSGELLVHAAIFVHVQLGRLLGDDVVKVELATTFSFALLAKCLFQFRRIDQGLSALLYPFMLAAVTAVV